MKVFRAFNHAIRYLREELISIFPALFFERKDLITITELRKKHSAKAAVVIGGGPSLNKMDLSLLGEYVTIACNGFFLKFKDLEWRPDYYLVEDPLPALDNKTELEKLDCSHKIFPFDLKHILFRGKGETTYVNFRRSKPFFRGKNFPYFLKDNAFPEFYWGGTVTYFSIQLAVYLGCNPIYLVGVDMNYVIPKTVRKKGIEIISVLDDDPNHFDPRYFGAGKKWHIPEVPRMQKSIIKGYEECKSRGYRLLNAGLDSKLRTVPKSDIFKKNE